MVASDKRDYTLCSTASFLFIEVKEDKNKRVKTRVCNNLLYM